MGDLSEFYNLYPHAKEAGYHFIHALGDRPPQSREFNELQSHYLDLFQRLANQFFENGTILAGCWPDNLAAGSLVQRISSGWAYVTVDMLDRDDQSIHTTTGLILPVPEQTVTLNAAGETPVYLKVTKDLVSWVNDPLLKNPAFKRPGYGRPGADREKIALSWTTESAGNTVLVFVFENGKLKRDAVRGVNNLVSQAIATRTALSDGDFLGGDNDLLVRAKGTEDGTKIQLSLDSGTAVVGGNSYVFSRLDLDPVEKALGTVPLYFSPAYKLDENGDPITQYSFGTGVVPKYDPALDEWTVMGTWEANASVDPSEGGNTIQLPRAGSIAAITAVRQTSDPASTSWTEGLHFDYENGKIVWKIAPPETSYYVEYKMTGPLIKEDEYTMVKDENPKAWKWNLEIRKALVADTYLTVTGKAYQGRVDLVEILKTGIPNVKRGTSPSMAPGGTLGAFPIAEVKIPAGPDLFYAPDPDIPDRPFVEITNYRISRVTQREMRNVLRRLEQQDFAAAAEELTNEAIRRASQEGLQINGAFSEGFISAKKLDSTAGTVEAGTRPNVAINVMNGTMTLPETLTARTLAVNTAATTAALKQSLALLPHSEVSRFLLKPTEAGEENKGSAELEVYRFAKSPKLMVYGAEDLFHETDRNKLAGMPVAEQATAQYVRGIWGEYPTSQITNETAVSTNQNFTARSTARRCLIKGRAFGSNENGLVAKISDWACRMLPKTGDGLPAASAGNKAIGTFKLKLEDPAANDELVFTVGEGAEQKSATYAVPQGMDLAGVLADMAAKFSIWGAAIKGFFADTNPVVVSNGLLLFTVKNRTPVLVSVVADKGSNPAVTTKCTLLETGSIKASVTGEFDAWLDVPSGIYAGDWRVIVASIGGEAKATYSIRTALHKKGEFPAYRFAPFQDILPEKEVCGVCGQSFRTSTLPITAVGLFFTEKAQYSPIEVQIREMVNGIPSNKILARKVLFPSDPAVMLPEAGDKFEKARETKVVFDDPIFPPVNGELAVVLDAYKSEVNIPEAPPTKIWKVVAVEGIANSNPYDSGKYFRASGTSWAAIDSYDLRLKVYEAKPNAGETTAYLTFDEVTADLTGFILRASQDVPAGATPLIDWQYQVDARVEWTPFTPGLRVDLGTPVSKLRLRAKLVGTTALTPWINVMALQLLTLVREKSGLYESLSTNYPMEWNKATVWFEQYAPEGTTVGVTLSDGNGWIPPVVPLENEPANLQMHLPDGFSRYKYTFDLSGKTIPGNAFKIRLNLGVTDQNKIPAKTPVVRQLVTTVSKEL